MSILQALADGGIRFEIAVGVKATWSATLFEVDYAIEEAGALWPAVSAGGLASYAEAEAWLAANAAARFPESAFAKRRNQPDPTTETRRPENKGALL